MIFKKGYEGRVKKVLLKIQKTVLETKHGSTSVYSVGGRWALEFDILQDMEQYGVLKIKSRKPERDDLIVNFDSFSRSKFEEVCKYYGITEQQGRMRERKSILEPPLPPGTNWEDLTIEFKDGETINILLNNKHQYTKDYKELGLFQGNTKEQKPNKQWLFLRKLSITENLINIAPNLLKEKEKIKQDKKKLGLKLQEIFSIYEDPFYDYKEKGGYKAKFTLKPETILRETRAEIYGIGTTRIGQPHVYSDSEDEQDDEGEN